MHGPLDLRRGEGEPASIVNRGSDLEHLPSIEVCLKMAFRTLTELTIIIIETSFISSICSFSAAFWQGYRGCSLIIIRRRLEILH